MPIRLLLSCLLMSFSWPSLSPGQEPTVYQVGVAKVDITPDYPIRLNGFGFRRDESEGVSERIYARALAISEGDEPPLVLIAIDSLGVRMNLVDQVAQRLQQAFDIPRERVALTFTHSHCTPKVNGASDNIFGQPIPPPHQERIDRYTAELTAKISQAAREAITQRQPAWLEWGLGAAGFAENRRTEGGPVDHDLPVLVVRDPENAEVRAVYASYACHCVTLSFNRISGDWAGYAAELVEQTIPGAVCLMSIGCGSDANPSSGVTGDKTHVAELQGAEIATEVQRLLQAGLHPVSGALTATLRSILLPLNEPPTKEQLEALAAQSSPAGYNAITQLARLARGQPLLRQIDYPIQTWRFGESLAMVFLAGEVCVDYSLRLKTELDRNRLWINAYSNDFCAYIPSERLLREGGYGGGAEIPYFALPATLKPGLEEVIVEEVKRQVPASWQKWARTQGIAPQSPSDSLRSLRTHDDLRVELAASEPLVSDPVAIDFGPDGRLWVAEMRDYGREVYEKFPQSSRIRWLRDEDGDGRFDEARTFVEGLRFPTDVKVWRNGVLICDAPEILFAEDRNGDGRADRTSVLFTGFEIRNAQARVNSLRFGLDNWLYGAGGLFGGRIHSSKTGQAIDVAGRDFRLNPDSGEIEPVSGRTQQGRDRNDAGDWFGCDNSSLILHFPIPDHYHRRNPRIAPPATIVALPDAQAERLIPPGEIVRFELSGAPGRATAACGLGIYRDELLGAEYRGNAFVCEPVHQLVHRLVLEPRGVTYAARRADDEQDSEFLTSTDRWFRPVQVRTGPDGALWVVDMYRYVIEHPRWIPQATLREVDVFAGQGMGRIYRVESRESQRHAADRSGSLWPRLDRLTAEQLVEQLDQPNGPLRDLAQQLLVWRKASEVRPQLQRLIQDARHPVAKLHALGTLQGLGLLAPEDLLAALRTEEPSVIRFAIRLAEPHLDESSDLLQALLRQEAHSDPGVRLQLAYSLGESRDPRAAATLLTLFRTADADAYQQAAVLSSLNPSNVADVFAALRKLTTAPGTNRDRATQQLLPRLLELGDAELVAKVLQSLVKPDEDRAALSAEQLVLLTSVLDAADARDDLQSLRVEETLAARVQEITAQAAICVAAADTAEPLRRAAVDLLARSPGSVTRRLLGSRLEGRADWLRTIAGLLNARHPADVQSQAVAALTRSGEPVVPPLLLEQWNAAGPAARGEILDALLARPTWTHHLLEGIESGLLKPTHLDAGRRQRLLTASRDEIRQRAERLLQSGSTSSRAEILETYRTGLSKLGDASQGRLLFGKHCATCHRLEGQGHPVGPDLAALTNRSPEWLLTAMLDPNRDVDARYISWTALLTDGRTVTGLIAEETSASIRLIDANGKEHIILRRDVDEFRSSDKSLMPEGLERDIDSAAAADLIAYLVGLESPPKSLPGNVPQVVTENDAGEYRLTAAVAELRGGDITFEPHFGNIGYWHGEHDLATWQLEVARGGEFDLYLDWSCANDSAGNRFRIEIGDGTFREQAAGTGGWDRYRQTMLGRVSLNNGLQTVRMQPDGPVQQALLDLRELRLVPVGKTTVFTASNAEEPLPLHPPQIAPFLLDDGNSAERRRALIDLRPGMGGAIIAHMVEDLTPGTEEEYRRIPWIWRVAIAAARRNDGGELRDLLDVSLPKGDEPLRDWQAVVIGGGVINGVSQLGLWPHERLAEILADVPDAKQRWPRALQLAAAMADKETVPTGTRYDALRMIALEGWERRGEQLTKYLADGVHDELQMGAVSGLSDVPADPVAGILIGRLAKLSPDNRKLAIEALYRTEQRSLELLQAVQSGKVARDLLDRESWLKHPSPRVQKRVREVWPE